MQYERLQYIMNSAKEKKFVSVEDVAQQLNVSLMTVRRDLNHLCNQGQLERCYGGARLPQLIVPEIEYDEKLQRNLDTKARIAKKALELIEEGDAVYLDSGTTIAELAKLIGKERKNVAVVTCDLNTATLLAKCGTSVTVVGGVLNNITNSVSGHASDQFLRQFRFSKAFLGASCIDYNFDTFSPNADKAHLKRLAAELSGKTYVAVDSSKFYNSAMIFISSLNQYAGVITDREFSKAEWKTLHEKNINIIPV